MQGRTWWHLYRVTLSPIMGESVTYPVVTDQGEHKAVAVAVQAHLRAGSFPVYRVSLVDEGTAPTDPGALSLVLADAHHDRMEW